MAWARVQSNSQAFNVPGASMAVAYTANVAANKLLAVSVVNGATTTSSVGDGTNNMTKVAAVLLDNTAADGELSLWAFDTPPADIGTMPTITATLSNSAASTGGLLIQEVSGLAVGNTLAAMIDGTAGTNFGTGGTSTGSPAYSSSAANEYLVTCVGDNEVVTNGNYTAPAGYTTDPNNLNNNNLIDVLIAFKNSTGGAESASWTMTTPNQWATILVAFKIAAAAHPAPLRPPHALLRGPRAPQAARTGRGARPAPPPPARFTPPPRPLRGPRAAQAARTGRGAGLLVVIPPPTPAPFYPPHIPLRGPAVTRPGRLLRPARGPVIPVTPISPPFPVFGGDILKPWRKRVWPRVDCQPPGQPPDGSESAGGPPETVTGPSIQPGSPDAAPAVTIPSGRELLGHLGGAATRRAARALPTGRLLDDPELAESLLYWQQNRKRKKPK